MNCREFFNAGTLGLAVLLAGTDALAAPHLSGFPEPVVASVGEALPKRLAARGLRAPSVYPATVRVLLLRVDFLPDSDANTTGNGAWDDPVYAEYGDADYWVRANVSAMADYYHEVSNGLLTLDITVAPALGQPAFRLTDKMAGYGSESVSAIERFIHDSVTVADQQDASLDFSQFDAMIIVHAGPGEETDVKGDTTADLWSLYYRDSQIGTGLMVDGKTITDAVIMPQTGSQDGETVDPLGVYVHEFGHWLGLPDLYVTSMFPIGDGIGKWGLMGSGLYNRQSPADPYGSSPAHPEAWSRYHLGWLAPRTLTDDENVSLGSIESGAVALAVSVSSAASSQYYLIENRQPTGYDRGLPGFGLLVWRIDPNVIASTLDSNSVNNSPSRPGVSLIEADGDGALRTIEEGCGIVPGACDDGSAGDPFPGATNNVAFNPATTPNSIPSFGSGYVNLGDIRIDTQGTASFRLGFGPPVGVSVNGAHSCGVTNLDWTATSATDIVSYRIWKNGVLLADVAKGPYIDYAAMAGDAYVVGATDVNGDATGTAWSVPRVVPECASSESKCFIATAAYGAPHAGLVRIMREFRDRFLLSHRLGAFAVKVYYEWSPPLADAIRTHFLLKLLAQLALLPAFAVAWYFVAAGLSLQIGIGAVLMALLVFPLRGRGSRRQVRSCPSLSADEWLAPEIRL